MNALQGLMCLFTKYILYIILFRLTHCNPFFSNAVVIFPATNSITFYFKKLFIFVVLKPSADHLKEDMYDVLTSIHDIFSLYLFRLQFM